MTATEVHTRKSAEHYAKTWGRLGLIAYLAAVISDALRNLVARKRS